MFEKLKIAAGCLAVGLVAGAIITEAVPKVKKTVSGGVRKAKKVINPED